MKMNLCFIWSFVMTIVVGMSTPLYANVVERFEIYADTYIDSHSPAYNFGLATTAKVVVNGTDGSLTRAMFKLPDDIWSIPENQVISANVWFYLFSDKTDTRTVRLHPLTTGFAEGTGNGTDSGDGATWTTYDGVNLWTTVGGDYKADVFVDAVKSPNWFSWDITGLWDDTNLRSFGALLKMNDESNPGVGNMPRAPFTSSDGTVGQRPYVEVICIPEPASLTVLGLLAAIGMLKRVR